MPSVELPPALDRVLRDYEQAWRNHDAEALAAPFTDDGRVYTTAVFDNAQNDPTGQTAIRL